MERITIPKAASLIINRLEEYGYEAYVVGGCVRDSIMGITPHDWDICTSALPEQIIEAFSDLKVIPTGLKHGTVTVVIDDCEFEVTTYRTDGEYRDNRHPETVEFVRDLKLDLMRRDFTINALAYNHKSGIIDYFNGVEDIHNKVIRCVGNPDDRLSEDALRIMRAVRFAIRFGFEIDSETKAALYRHRTSLLNISAERINAEIVKSMMSDLRGKESLLHEFITLLNVIIPEFCDVNTKAISERVANSIGIYKVGLALLFDFDDEKLESVLRRLRFPNDVIKDVTTINRYGRRIRDDNSWWSAIDTNLASNMYNKSDYYERKLLHDICYEQTIMSIYYARAFSEENSLDNTMLKILDLRVGHAFINNEACSLSDLEVDGNDLMEIGLVGKEVGDTLNALLDMVMRNAILNDYDNLMKVAKSIKEYLI